jgi:hypothetical protein
MKLLASMNDGVRLWTHDQSIDSFLHRFLYSVNFTTDWVAVSPTPLRMVAGIVKCALIAWWLLVAISKRRPADATVSAGFALLALIFLLPPISWSHYGLLLVPGLALLALRPGGRTLAHFSRAGAVLGAGVLAVNPDKLITIYPALTRSLGEAAGSVVYRIVVGAPTLVAAALGGFLLVTAGVRKGRLSSEAGI